MRRHALRDDQWDKIKDVLPGREGHVGVAAKDSRLFVEAVLYRYRAGIPWRDLPKRFGDPIKIHTCFSRWAKSGDALLPQMQADALLADTAFDADERVIEPLLEISCRMPSPTAGAFRILAIVADFTRGNA